MRRNSHSDGQADPSGASRESDLFAPAFDVLEPKALTSPLVFSSPHSGHHYPAAFLSLSRLDALTLRRSEDAYVDDLFKAALTYGAPLLRARFPRAWLDVNREPFELDPRMFDGRLPPFANTRSIRVAGGLGTIARVVGDGQEIYAGRLPVADALERVETLYKPYHAALLGLLTRAHDHFGLAVLLDCHSMPSTASKVASAADSVMADIVLGDRHGASCAPWLIDIAENYIAGLGYCVRRNKPYAGGFITETYGNPTVGWHALQIEINRALYMDEKTMERSPIYPRLRHDLCGLVKTLSEAAALSPDQRAAAE